MNKKEYLKRWKSEHPNYDKEWAIKNRDKKLEHKKNYRLRNPGKIKEQQKRYRENNKDKLNKIYKDYIDSNEGQKLRALIRRLTWNKYGTAKICSICNSTEKIEHHHIEPYNVDNFIDLCSKCHTEIHK